MDGDDDLDADLALFERQIQLAKASASASPNDVSRAAALQPNSSSADVTQVKQQTQLNEQPLQSKLPRTQHENIKSQPSSKSETDSGERWFWDGTTWRWRAKSATLAEPGTSTSLPEAQVQRVEQNSKGSSTKRTAAGQVWNDPTLADWPSEDHRIFVGDLAPDATEKHLSDAFGVYPSFEKAKVVRDKRSGSCRGYGFVSFSDGRDMVRALRELNGKYVGGRPVKLKRSNWQKRSLKGEKWKELRAFKKIAKK